MMFAGNALARVVEMTARKHNLNMTNLRGQGYDGKTGRVAFVQRYLVLVAGASNMAGRISGLQAILLKSYPCAIYVHCHAHVLNLAVMEAVQVAPVQNLRYYLVEIGKFFRPARRRHMLTNCVNQRAGPQFPPIPTIARWTSLDDVTRNFVKLFPCIANTLSAIANAESQFDAKVRSTAERLKEGIASYELVLTAVVSIQ